MLRPHPGYTLAMERLGPVVATVTLPDAASARTAARAARAAGADRVELRIDALARPEDALALLDLAAEMPLLASGSRDAVRESEIAWLRRFQEAGAWVDLPWAPNLPESLWGLDRNRLVLSWHDFGGTPRDLMARLAPMRELHPAVCKIVPTARDFGDLLAVKDLLGAGGNRRDLCAFAMGAPGVASRALALAWGSCATYASVPGCPPAAPGQTDLSTLLEVYRPRDARAEDPLYAVAGWPLLRTGSPSLHNRWLAAMAFPGRFVPLPVHDFETFLRRAGELPLRGLAITVPHKVLALRLASGASRLARRVGACNTLLPIRGGWMAANTDVYGIRAALAPVPRGSSALLLGAGGAAASVAFVLARRGPLAVAARDGVRAETLASRFGAKAVPWRERTAIPCDLLANATPCGQEGEESPYPLDGLRAPWVFDMVVREGGTPLLGGARAKGLGTIPGEAMLEAQARLQFRLFTGHRPPR